MVVKFRVIQDSRYQKIAQYQDGRFFDFLFIQDGRSYRYSTAFGRTYRIDQWMVIAHIFNNSSRGYFYKGTPAENQIWCNMLRERGYMRIKDLVQIWCQLQRRIKVITYMTMTQIESGKRD